MSKRTEKLKEFSRMPKENLQLSLAEKREKLRGLRFDLVAGKVKNIRQIREIKKDIARIKTILKRTDTIKK